MNHLKQFALLLSICFAGEVLHALLPLPVPASIYGLVVLFALLMLKIVPLSAVEDASSFLLSIMPIFFVPSTVGLVTAGAVLKEFGVRFLLIGIAATIIVFAVTGRTTQGIIRLRKKAGKRRADGKKAEGARHE